MAAQTKPKQPEPEKAKPRRTLGIKVPNTEAVNDRNQQAPATESDDEPDIRDVIRNIDELFDNLGTDKLPATQLPVAKHRNNAQAAADYVLAEHLKKRAEERFKAAKEEAEKAGIFGDEDQYIEGQTVQVWQSPHYTVSVKKGKPSRMVDKELVSTVLIDRLGAEKAKEAMEECFKPRAGATSIIVSIK